MGKLWLPKGSSWWPSLPSRLGPGTRSWQRYQGVSAFVGMPGSGKTYSLAELGSAGVKAGMRVYSNAGFDLVGTETISSFDEFSSLKGPCLVVWDELPLFFNARKWAEFPDGMLYKFTQIRKDGIRLAYSAIHESMIDVNIRRITFWYWECESYGRRWFRRRRWAPHEFRREREKPREKHWVRVKPAVFQLYDTYAKVAVQQDVRERITVKTGDRGRFVIPGSAGGDGG